MSAEIQKLGEIDRMIHEPARLMVVALLSAVKEADFQYLHQNTGLSKGNLSVHLSKLEEAGYISIEKTFRGKYPLTICRLTDRGREVLETYRAVIRRRYNTRLYTAKTERYDAMEYRRCGRSGILLPAVSLGLWHNFGGVDSFENGRAILRRAFDLGVTHFDLANNYGPPYGSAEETFGQVLRLDLRPYRDEMIVSTKAGYDMWPGPYGNWGSRKYLLASLDQSLKRMGLEYVDIFYSHRPDVNTPVEETMSALDQAVRSGRALYAGISNYNPEQTTKALAILRGLGTPCLIHQFPYSMFRRAADSGLLELLQTEAIGGIAFSPLAQGLLTDRYLDGIPDDSRAGKPSGYLKPSQVDEARVAKARALNLLARERGQSLAQMAVAWVLRHSAMTSAIIGASRVEQLEQTVAALANLQFAPEELAKLEAILL